MKSFIYQDEKSHKFWAVEQQDNELHLSWGKVGTSGQSQIKTFADSATAAKAKQKLIGEKTTQKIPRRKKARPRLSLANLITDPGSLMMPIYR